MAANSTTVKPTELPVPTIQPPPAPPSPSQQLPKSTILPMPGQQPKLEPPPQAEANKTEKVADKAFAKPTLPLPTIPQVIKTSQATLPPAPSPASFEAKANPYLPIPAGAPAKPAVPPISATGVNQALPSQPSMSTRENSLPPSVPQLRPSVSTAQPTASSVANISQASKTAIPVTAVPSQQAPPAPSSTKPALTSSGVKFPVVEPAKLAPNPPQNTVGSVANVPSATEQTKPAPLPLPPPPGASGSHTKVGTAPIKTTPPPLPSSGGLVSFKSTVPRTASRPAFGGPQVRGPFLPTTQKSSESGFKGSQAPLPAVTTNVAPSAPTTVGKPGEQPKPTGPPPSPQTPLTPPTVGKPGEQQQQPKPTGPPPSAAPSGTSAPPAQEQKKQ